MSTVKLPDICLVGKAGAGKTTAAELLVEHFGYARHSFAAPLKDIAAQLWGEDARTDRHKLQSLGVAVREIEPDTWVDLLVGTPANPGEPWTVDDCRFPNEFDRLTEAAFVTVRIEADRDVRVDRLHRNGKLTDIAQLEHVSEIALDDCVCNYVISNSSSDPAVLLRELTAVLNREQR